MTQSETTKSNPKLWTRDFLLICLANFLIFTSFYFLLPTIPIYAKESLKGSDALVGIIMGAFTLSAVVIRPFIGKLLDTKGRRPILLISLLIFILAVFGYHLSTGIIMLLAFRVFHGLGWGASTTAASTLVADLVPPPRRGEGMGYSGLSVNLAMVIAPAMGLAIIARLNFAWLFASSITLIISALLLVLLIRFPQVLPKIVPVNDSGAANPSGTMAAQVNASSKPAGLIEHSSLPYTAILFFIAFVYGGIVSFIPLFAGAQNLGNEGLFFTVMAIFIIIIRPIAGSIFDKKGPGVVIPPGIIMILLAALLLGQTKTVALFLVAAALIGLGFGTAQPALQAVVVNLVEPARRGAATATLMMGMDLGIGIGAMVLGLLAQQLGYAQMYTYSAFIGFFGLLVYWWKVYQKK